MAVLWEAGNPEDPYADRGFVQLSEHSDDGFQLLVHDGAEGADYRLTSEELLDLAFKIYEELG